MASLLVGRYKASPKVTPYLLVIAKVEAHIKESPKVTPYLLVIAKVEAHIKE